MLDMQSFDGFTLVVGYARRCILVGHERLFVRCVLILCMFTVIFCWFCAALAENAVFAGSAWFSLAFPCLLILHSVLLEMHSVFLHMRGVCWICGVFTEYAQLSYVQC